MAEFARRPELGYHAIGYIDDETRLIPGQAPHLGPPADLRVILDREQPSRIVIGREDFLEALPIHELIEWRFLGFRVEGATSTYETVFHRVPTRTQPPPTCCSPHAWILPE